MNFNGCANDFYSGLLCSASIFKTKIQHYKAVRKTKSVNGRFGSEYGKMSYELGVMSLYLLSEICKRDKTIKDGK